MHISLGQHAKTSLLRRTMANHVYMMDCWCKSGDRYPITRRVGRADLRLLRAGNEAIENQAIDRVHRLGQTKPVFVTRFIIKKTIERRILKIREWQVAPLLFRGRCLTCALLPLAERRKTALVNASLSGKASSDGSSLEDLRAIFGLDGEDSEEDD